MTSKLPPIRDASGDAPDTAPARLDPSASRPEEPEEPLAVDALALDTAPIELPQAETGESSRLVRYDPLDAYFRELKKYPLLGPGEEHDLAVRYHQSGDLKAAARLVTSNLRLVVKIAYGYRRAYRNVLDLIQEGNMGLMQAVRHFDPYRGVKLSSYAAFWIRAYILRYLIHNFRLVKIGTTQAQRKLFFNLNKEKARLAAMGFEPSALNVAKRLRVSEQEVIEMDRRMGSSELTLDAPAGRGDGEGRPTSRVELLPSPGARADDDMMDQQLNDRLHAKLDEFSATLSGKDKTIYEKRLIADEPLTLQQIGDEFNVSRERVRQIEKRLQEKLKAFLSEQMGELLQFE